MEEEPIMYTVYQHAGWWFYYDEENHMAIGPYSSEERAREEAARG